MRFNYKYIFRLFLFLLLIIVNFNKLVAQVYINGTTSYYGTSITFNTDVIVSSTGDLNNVNADIYFNSNIENNGTIQGDGNFYLQGNWINNNIFTGNSNVNLTGVNQSIEGTSVTTFYNLNLQGTGIKTANINVNVSNNINLTDREFSLGDYTCFVQNTNTNAILLTTGFFSTTLNGGLSRVTASVNDYLYPLGSSIGTQRYRPVLIKPTSANSNTYKVSFINNDANNDGFNRSQIDTGICGINPEFYHRIIQTSGSDSADINIKYNETTDGFWENIVRWNNSSANIWNKLPNITQTTGSPFNTIAVQHWSNLLNNEPIAIAKGSLVYNLGNDTGYCTGGSVTIDAGSGYTSYLWSNNANTQTITVSSPGMYYVTVSNGSCDAVDSINITEDALPHITMDKNKYICFGDTATLIASGGGSYSWSNGDTTSSISITPQATTQYILTVTNGYCSDTASAMVYVNPLPVANAGNNQSVCQGDTVTLSASGSVNYLWNTGDTTSSIVVSPTNTTTYYVTVSDTLNCSAVDSVTVTTNTVPNVTTSNDTTICNGDNVDIFANGGNSYVWNNGQTTNIITVLPSSSTSYTVTVSNGGCSKTDTVIVDVHDLPSISITASNTSICEGDTVNLTANGSPPFLWNTGDTTQNISYYVNSNTSFSVYVNDSLCSNTDSVFINVSTKPLSKLENKDICINDSVNLFVNNNTTYTYEWTDSLNNMILNNHNNPVVYPQSTSVYYVTITNNACVVIDSAKVTVHDFPDVYIVQSDTSVIEGVTINLTAITDSSNTILWNPNNNISDINVYNPTITPENNITYYVSSTNEFGCTSVDSIKIQVTPAEEYYTITIYNTFTPNNDGTNDFFHIENLEYFPINTLTIYNRDGHIVYQTDNYNNNWDGKYYGNDLPAATYYYVLQIPNLTPSIYKGNVTIIR